MTIGILGCGRMGTALAHAFGVIGERVLMAGRTAEAPDAIRRAPRVAVVDTETLVDLADLVVLALPFAAALELAQEGRLADGRGRVLVDATNPRIGGGTLARGLSGGELLARRLTRWRVVKALNTVPAVMVNQPALGGRPVTVPVAGEDPAAKAEVFALVRRLGYVPVDAGGIAHAGAVEGLAELLVTISSRHGLEGRVGFQLAGPGPGGQRPRRPPLATGVRSAGSAPRPSR